MNIKRKLLKSLSKNLASFCPEYTHHFMCPTCKKVIPLANQSQISVAHIFPKYAGGEYKTFLCKECNSHFGSKQDKWFGEFLKIRSKDQTVLHSEKQTGYFEIDGIKVSGKYRVDIDGTIQFGIHMDRCSPSSLSALDEWSNKPSSSMEITFKSPLQENSKLINVGFLTAAYLFWFRELGYSWVFQSHLDQVKEQILHPDDNILTNKYLFKINDQIFNEPRIGAVEISGEFAPAMVISDMLVLFPPASHAKLYEDLQVSSRADKSMKYEMFGLVDSKEFGEPFGVIYRDVALIYPDHFKDFRVKPVMLFYPGEGKTPQLMRKISTEEYIKLQNDKNAIRGRVVFK